MAYEKIQMLLGINRLEQAENEARKALIDHPEDAHLNCLLGISLYRRDQLNEAEAVFRRAIEIDPHFDTAYAQLGLVLYDRNQFKAAIESIDEAIRIDPEDAGHFGIKSSCLFGIDKFSQSLAAAKAGLELDPEDESCRMFHSLALSALGHGEAADEEALSLLADVPESADSHIARGFVLFESNPSQAQKHFLEALRIDPTEETAKLGLAQTIKLQNPLVGWIIRLLLWTDKIPLWAFIVGFVVVTRITRFLASSGLPGIVVVGKLLNFALLCFCLVASVQRPLFDLVLSLTREGRESLSEASRQAVKWSSPALLFGAGCAAWFCFDDKFTSLVHAFVWCGIAALIYDSLTCENAWIRKRLLWGTIAATVFGFAFLAYDFGVYRPKSRSIEAQHVAQARLEAREIISDDVDTQDVAAAEMIARAKQLVEIGKRNDDKLNMELKDHRMSLIYWWGPFVMAIVLAGSWSDEIIGFLRGKAPDSDG